MAIDSLWPSYVISLFYVVLLASIWRCDGQMRSSIREPGVPGLVAGLSIAAEGLLCWQLDGVFALLAVTVCSGGFQEAVVRLYGGRWFTI